MKLIDNVLNLKYAIKELNFSKEYIRGDFKSYKNLKYKYNISLFKNSLENINKTILRTNSKELDELNIRLQGAYREKNIEEMFKILEKIEKIAKLPSSERRISFKIPNLPDDINDDIRADIKELERCYKSNCLRSSIILCGRVLESALHRKYYEITKIDLLEKAPGIGLGKIIAKLKEKNIEIEPGLMQQIHLINQVRVFSVHKKPNLFKPSKKQTEAIILYTLDVLEKMF